MEQYPALNQSGNARLCRKLKGMRHMPAQAVGMRPALSKGVVELTNAPKTETLRKHMKAQRDLEEDFAENGARAATALALREKAPTRSYPQRTHYPLAKTL